MNLGNWQPFFKLDENGKRCMAQQTYEPLINPERTVFCANYDWLNTYQKYDEPVRELYTKEVVDYFFGKEIEYAHRFSTKPWGAKIIEIDYLRKRLFVEWNGETANEIIYSKRNFADYCPDWREQYNTIMTDMYKDGVYKLTMYPHCHYVDKGGVLRTLDWYGCVEVNDPFIEAKYMDGIIHHTALFRLAETGDLINGRYNLENMFKGSLGTHVLWGDEPMKDVYFNIFGKQPDA